MRLRNLIPVTALAVTLALILGCGGDDGGPNPLSSVAISAAKTEIEIGHATEITATVRGGENRDLTWSVNGIENGDEVHGTITQNSPVTYNAPDSLPDIATIVIGAVSVEDTTKMDTCRVRLEFKKIFVDASGGDDAAGTGCINQPVKSITHGLSLAEEGMAVIVLPGVYDEANGEVFQIDIPPGVALVGMDWETCVIRGHNAEDTGYQGCVAVSGNGASFRNFTVEMGLPVDPRWSLAVYVTGDSTVVDSIRMHERANYSALRSSGTEGGAIENCWFSVDDGAVQGRGFEIVFGNMGTTIRNCSFYGYRESIFFNGDTDPLVEDCTFANCQYGVNMCCVDDVNHNPHPDLGGGARGSTGGNIFTGYTVYGLQNPTMNTIYAKFNTWDNDPPVLDEDYHSSGSGSIVVE